MLSIADALSDGNIATVAIDLPLHGLTTTSGLYMKPVLDDATNISGERTFDVDYVTQNPATGNVISEESDGIVDSSGRHFINLKNILTARDNIRQGIADLFVLTARISKMDYDGGGRDFDGNNIFFVGHSLGGIIGAVFLANEPDVKQSVLIFAGGGIAKQLDGSPSFGPEIAAGLAATAGIFKGTTEFEVFLGAAQTVLDSADPINYATATVSGRGLLMLEIIGDGGGILPDQVVPNHVGTLAKEFLDAPEGTVSAPLSGTDPFGSEMAMVRVSGSSAALGPVAEAQPWLRFTAGVHGSILDPTVSLLATRAMQAATVSFLASGGLGFDISTIPDLFSVLE